MSHWSRIVITKSFYFFIFFIFIYFSPLVQIEPAETLGMVQLMHVPQEKENGNNPGEARAQETGVLGSSMICFELLLCAKNNNYNLMYFL